MAAFFMTNVRFLSLWRPHISRNTLRQLCSQASDGGNGSNKDGISKDSSDTNKTEKLPDPAPESKPGWAKAMDMFMKLDDEIATEEVKKPEHADSVDKKGKVRRKPRMSSEFRPVRKQSDKKLDFMLNPTDTFTHQSFNFDYEAHNKKRDTQSFATLLKNSKFIEMGNPEGHVVVGTIIVKEGNDLYIDFGGKFHCVCPIPATADDLQYRAGSKVRVRLHDLELSSRFLGAPTDLTLLEADATLIGPLKRRTQRRTDLSPQRPTDWST